MHTIALANQKGGVGKTTTAASFAVVLSRQSKKVLLVDADAQGNLTQLLGWEQEVMNLGRQRQKHGPDLTR